MMPVPGTSPGFLLPQSGEELLTLDGHKMLGAMDCGPQWTVVDEIMGRSWGDHGEIMGGISWLSSGSMRELL